MKSSVACKFLKSSNEFLYSLKNPQVLIPEDLNSVELVYSITNFSVLITAPSGWMICNR